MSLIGVPLESISKAHLQALIDNQVAEDKFIEYKLTLPGADEKDKAEFLGDVSAFANTAGGHIVYGIVEENGTAKELRGLRISNLDAEKLRLENLIRDGIEPRPPGISFWPVDLESSNYALVIRISRSWLSPHRVKMNSRFYGRNSAGKFPLDVAQLREAFLLSETSSERIRNFRTDRLLRISTGETPVPLREGAKIVLHIVPLKSFQSLLAFDLGAVEKDTDNFLPMDTTTSGSRFNFDGVVTCSYPLPSHDYLQVFRNGVIEAVDVFLSPGDLTIPSVGYEKELLKFLPRFALIQKNLGVEPPLFIMLSLLGVKDCTMPHKWSFEEVHPIDRDSLVVPEVLVESSDFDAAQIMKPAFDTVWNAAGFPRSMNYDEKTGKWVGKE
jgi:hypothetical protein